MQQKTPAVNLREVLRHAFASLPAGEVDACQAGSETSDVVPVTRTAGDRSRMRQKVVEELARRRSESKSTVDGARGSPAESPAPSAEGEQGLFGEVGGSAMARPESGIGSRPASAARVRLRASTDVRELVGQAYRSLMRRLPEDHVILDPLANAEFIVRCKELGAKVSELVLNRTLLNNRKAKRHADVIREPVAGLAVGMFDQIGHAVEIAAGLVQRKWVADGHEMPSVDDILCHPELRHSFGDYVTALHEDVDLVAGHLVLLAFRKSGRESARRLARVDAPARLFSTTLQALDPADVPEGCGVYRLLCKRRSIFVSGTANLRQRMLRHILRGSELLLSDRVPFEINGPVSVEVFPGPPHWLPRRADAVARSMRIDDNPDLNWREKGMLFSSQSCLVPRVAVACG